MIHGRVAVSARASAAEQTPRLTALPESIRARARIVDRAVPGRMQPFSCTGIRQDPTHHV